MQHNSIKYLYDILNAIEYDSIDDSIVWAIKTNHLPHLKKEIITIIQ